ncbi:MAG: 3-oxoacid CoA-transferase subunit B [Synergistetes bacterium]|nr:MAG: Succinyl-CoA:3-ketoacid-coenzyme A transferase, B subunit [bacterium 42_11]MBC7332530.1 3-oxoacid CoA-transferase subunit B [Synergistota bacterium]MDK2871980.1 acetate CoA/acetoacetate CoA-transferase beta subunit [bacterium]
MLIGISEVEAKVRIAKRIAREFKDGDVVNLGIGIPSLVSDYIPEGVRVIFHTENGMLGAGPKAREDEGTPDIIGAGGVKITVLPGGSFFSSDISFGLIRGGHIDVTVLGALEVDEEGNLANWMIPGKLIPGMGGAMDLVTGARKVFVATLHTVKGRPKIVKRCSLPLTGKRVVNKIFTELAVFEVTPEGLLLKEIAPEVDVSSLKRVTEPDFKIEEPLKIMEV